MKDLHEIAMRSRQSFYRISVSNIELRNAALLRLADLLVQEKNSIFDANRKDYTIAESEQLSPPLLHRLTFGEEKLQQVVLGLKSLAEMEDPLNHTLASTEITEGLNLYKVSAPIGVIGVIFESRPDALIQIASLCIKSGNSVLLKGGREALGTNQALICLVRQALTDSGLPADSAHPHHLACDAVDRLRCGALRHHPLRGLCHRRMHAAHGGVPLHLNANTEHKG